MVENLAVAPRGLPAERSEEDRVRLGRMFEAYHEVVWRVLRRRGLGRDTASDVTQETFLIAAERLADIHPKAERSFLLATALRAAHTMGRKTMRWQLDDALHLRGSGARDVGDEHADIQLCDRVLSSINPELAEVFVLFEAEELSLSEIAELLTIPRGSVASRLRRAREQFRTVVTRIERTMQREGNT